MKENGHTEHEPTNGELPMQNGKTRSYKGRKRGPKSKWGNVDPIKAVVIAGKLGATKTQIAAMLGVTPQGLRDWARKKKQLLCALDNAENQKNNQVVHSLFQRATGYKHKAVKIMVVDGKVHREPYTEHYAPDTAAAVFWLKNRSPEQWRDKNEQVLSNPDGTSVQGGTTVIAPTVVFVQPPKEEKLIGNGHATEV